MLRVIYRVGAAMTLAVIPAALLAAAEPTPVDVLFKSRQLDLIDKGAEVKYRFERKASDEKVLGASFADEIKLGVKNLDEKGAREVALQVFSGDRARDPQGYIDLTINPLFIWYLDRSVTNFRMLGGGHPPYLKQRFSQSFMEGASIDPIKVTYKGKEVDAYRVTTLPYAKDPNAPKMKGFEKSEFKIIVSKDVPGYFYDLSAVYSSELKGTAKLEERVSVVDMGAMQ